MYIVVDAYSCGDPGGPSGPDGPAGVGFFGCCIKNSL